MMADKEKEKDPAPSSSKADKLKGEELSPHKRSRSAIALSRLSTTLSHKSSSKGESTDHLNVQKDHPSPTMSSTPSTNAALSPSPTLYAPSSTGLQSETGSVRSTTKSLRKKISPAAGGSHNATASASTAAGGGGGAAGGGGTSGAGAGAPHIPTSASVPVLAPRNMSIEDSVKTFRLFEALRNGDTLAIMKAIRESSSAEVDTGIEIHSILYLAVQCAETQVVQFIMSSTSRDPEASSATAAGVKPYLDINYRDPSTGNTALHLAAQLGRTPIVSLLLRETSINDALVNFHGAQAIDMARSPEIAQELTLSRSIYLDDHVSQLNDYIARQEYDKLTEMLEVPRTRMLLDLNAQDGGVLGSTLLHEAARRKDTRLIQILLLHGADPFRRDRKGKLPQDVTKDEKTKAVLKKSPAAMAAQQSIQEKAVLGSGAGIQGVEEGHTVGDPAKEGREMKGYLKKWTNYTGGYKLRWFVLENGVLSYYKHQDDMESACRGAINMRIARLHMDPQDKQRFEILGKSSVKYHLKANHQVEAKRWYWALNNAIQWAKDEAKDEEERKRKLQAQLEAGRAAHVSGSVASDDFERMDASTDFVAASERRGSRPHSGIQRVRTAGEGSVMGDTDNEQHTASEGERGTAGERMNDRNSDDDDGDYEMLDDNSSHGKEEPHSQDSFNLAAHSAKLQLDMLSHIGSALTSESVRHPNMPISNPGIMVALSSYGSAVQNLKGLVSELLKMSRERDAYWKYRLDKEVDLRKIWEENMTKLAVEQEQLEDRMGQVEEKRKRTKRALREVLKEGGTPRRISEEHPRDLAQALDKLDIDAEGQLKRKKSTLNKQVDMALSDSDDQDASDEEFFDAVDAGEVEVALEMPSAVAPTPATQYASIETEEEKADGAVDKIEDEREKQLLVIKKSFRGYEDEPRFKFNKSVDDRPKISLWGILKSMIGKDMTKMTLPVSFNECTSLLQRVAEDMEYTDLLDAAADRLESTERLVYVAAFAASEYSSTINRIAKPFNPLLGETYEYCRPDKNFRFFIEQVSHHPPIGAAWAESPKWEYWGESSVRSKFYGKSFDINPLGTWFLKLRPASGGEELYTWKKVNTSVIGIITGSPTVDNYGPMEIRNHTTGDVCRLDFKARGWRSAGAYEVKGRVLDDTETQRWSMGGRWNDKLYARLSPGYDAAIHSPPAGLPAGAMKDGSKSPTQHTGTTFSTDAAFLVWQTHDRPPAPFNLTPFAISLNYLPDGLRDHLCPTDTRLRPDQRAMEDGLYDFAASEKTRLEEKQRAKRREREQNGELYNPRWFHKSKCEITGEEFWQTNGEYWVNRDKASNGGEWERVMDIF